MGIDPSIAAYRQQRTKKILLIALTGIICIVGIIAFAVYQASFTKIDARQWLEVTYSGLNGNAVSSVSRDSDYMDGQLVKALGISSTDLEDYEDLYGFAAAAASELQVEKLYDSLDFDVEVSPSDHLSNGDQISVKITYDEAAAKEASVKVQNAEFTVTVEGLSEGKEYDIFQNVRLTYEGTSPSLKAFIDVSACDSFVKDHTTFQIAPQENLKNGDKLTVTASWDRSAASENLYLITKETQEYTVSGQPEYLSTLKDKTLPGGLQTEINDYIEAKIIAAYPPYTSMPGGEGSIESIKLKGLYRQYFLVKKTTSDSYGDENRLIQIYRFTASNENGAKDIYAAVFVNNLIKSGEEVSWDEIWQKGPYEKAEDLIKDYITTEKSDYTVETAE